MFRAVFLFIIFGFLLGACKSSLKQIEENQVEKSYDIGLHSSGSIVSLGLDSRIVNSSSCLFPFIAPDSTRYLYFLNGGTNCIYVFNLDSRQLIHSIRLDFEGPDGVGAVMGFEVVSPDSLFITSSFMHKLYLVNSTGKVVSKVDYSNYKKDYLTHSGLSRSLENMRVAFDGHKIYLPFYPSCDLGNYTSIKPKNIRMVAVVDTLSKEIGTLNIGFPQGYWDEHFFSSFFGFFEAKGIFYVNYIYDERIATSDDGQVWQYFRVPSRYADVRDYVPEEKGVGACYSRLVYDPYRDVFYRFVEYAQILTKDRTHTDLIRYPENFSIIILDKDLNIIGETKFPPNVYEMNGYMVMPEGLYLSRSYPFSVDYDVDKLVFELFKLKENEN